MHSAYVKGPGAQAREVSWHITVDYTQAIQHLPFHEVGWHIGREETMRPLVWKFV